jgi:hypothetical protein
VFFLNERGKWRHAPPHDERVSFSTSVGSEERGKWMSAPLCDEKVSFSTSVGSEGAWEVETSTTRDESFFLDKRGK